MVKKLKEAIKAYEAAAAAYQVAAATDYWLVPASDAPLLAANAKDAAAAEVRRILEKMLKKYS